MKDLKEIFSEKDKFLIGAELVTTRGNMENKDSIKLEALANDLCSNKQIDWISITDNAGGNPRLAPEVLGRKLHENDMNCIIHLTCKDFNRNALESLAWKYDSEGFHNILAITGDYPISGFRGTAQPVFDIDSVALIKMLNEMNNGMIVPGRKPGTTNQLSKTNFFTGCAVSPFKHSEAEQMIQYQKLNLKIQNGANYIIPQLGYDIRKSHELLTYLKTINSDIPVIGNIYKLTPGVARIFNKGIIPGCTVSDALLERINQEKTSEDKGKAFFIDVAARQFAAFKGLGYKGAYIGGINKHEDFEAILEKAKEYKSSNWIELVDDLSFSAPKTFFLFEKSGNGLNTDNLSSEYTDTSKRKYRKWITPGYRFNRAVHTLVFRRDSKMFKFAGNRYKFIEKHKGLDRLSYKNEKLWKTLLFDCKECGDCSLPDMNYLCPQSQCMKNQRNGACGGSNNDKCEVEKTGKDCIWVKAYYRNKFFNGNTNILDRQCIIKNNELENSSGWANYYLNRDHSAPQNKE
jgi:methylenetetrahydrofolate reductase (NADPH)